MPRRMATWLGAAFLACLPVSLQAVPFLVNGDTGPRGAAVQVSLVDQRTDRFESATIEIRFDPAYLRFNAAALGELIGHAALAFDLTLNDDDEAGGTIVVSLASGADAIDMASGELLRLSFEILAAAPLGSTPVSFQCRNPTATGADSCAHDYLIPLTSGFITVLSSGASVPAPASLLLLSFGLALITVRKRQGPADRQSA